MELILVSREALAHGRLDGPINEQTCVKNGFPLALVRHFKDGFPIDWIDSIASYFHSDSRLTRSLEPDRLFRNRNEQSRRVDPGAQASAIPAVLPTPRHATSERAPSSKLPISTVRLSVAGMMCSPQL
jgi:hypothetical protein